MCPLNVTSVLQTAENTKGSGSPANEQEQGCSVLPMERNTVWLPRCLSSTICLVLSCARRNVLQRLKTRVGMVAFHQWKGQTGRMEGRCALTVDGS
jgi:hypothetical protein